MLRTIARLTAAGLPSGTLPRLIAGEVYDRHPQDVFDAARVDGASEYRIFFQVVVPMVKPAMATLAIIFSLEQWNDLLWPLIVMRSEENYPLAVGITSLVGLYRARWDLVMTASVIAVVPIMILFFLMRKQFINGLGQFGTGGR